MDQSTAHASEAPETASATVAPPPWPRITPWFILRNLEEIISCLGMVVIIVVISINVLMRYCFAKSMSWTEEISVIGFSCVIFLGSAAVFKRNMHVGIDFLVGMLPAPARWAINLLTSVFLVVFNGYITYLAWVYSVESWEKPTSILFIPYFFVNIPICLGFLSMTGYAARNLVDIVRGGRAAEGGQA